MLVLDSLGFWDDVTGIIWTGGWGGVIMKLTTDKWDIWLVDVSSLDRCDHSKLGLHVYTRGKETFVQLIADGMRCKPDTGNIPLIIGAR